MQYLLFAGYNYYPGGGMNDFVDEYDSIESARSDLAERDTDYDWWHIYDMNTGLVYYDEDLTEEENGL